MREDTYPPRWPHTEQLFRPKNPRCSRSRHCRTAVPFPGCPSIGSAGRLPCQPRVCGAPPRVSGVAVLSNVPPSGRAAACWPVTCGGWLGRPALRRGRSGCRHCRAQERARTEVFGCRGNARERDCWVAWSVFGPVGDSHASSRAAVPFASPPQLMPLPVAPGAGAVGRAAASAVRWSLASLRCPDLAPLTCLFAVHAPSAVTCLRSSLAHV